jgi:uncharacterized protein
MLTVLDATQTRTLVDHGRTADTFWTRLKGLIGVRRLPEGDGLLIRPAKQIHTHFMSIPIDVVYLKGDGTVVDFDERMGPWRIGALRKESAAVLELPAGAVAAQGVQRGDRLEIQAQDRAYALV